jgi:hypothetical protein
MIPNPALPFRLATLVSSRNYRDSTLGRALKECEAELVAQSGIRFFVWRRPVKDELQEDSQDANVFFPRRGFLLEGQMQSESAVGVRLKVYRPYFTFAHHLLANGDLLFEAGESTVQSLLPCGFHLAAKWPCVHGRNPRWRKRIPRLQDMWRYRRSTGTAP